MKLLTHNMLACHIKGVKNGYPFKIEATKVEECEADFDLGALHCCSPPSPTHLTVLAPSRLLAAYVRQDYMVGVPGRRAKREWLPTDVLTCGCPVSPCTAEYAAPTAAARPWMLSRACGAALRERLAPGLVLDTLLVHGRSWDVPRACLKRPPLRCWTMKPSRKPSITHCSRCVVRAD
jgi:hypothetical protein